MCLLTCFSTLFHYKLYICNLYKDLKDVLKGSCHLLTVLVKASTVSISKTLLKRHSDLPVQMLSMLPFHDKTD